MAVPEKAAGRVASVMQEDRVFPPPAEFSRQARITSLADYKKLYDEAADDLDELDRRTLAARALEATRAAITAPRPILAAFLEDGTYSIGQLAAVLDVSTWTPAELDRLEAAQDRDRLALALEIDGVRP